MLLALLLVCGGALAQPSVVKVGTFSKTTARAPASQSVNHGLGQVPKAIFLWLEGPTADGVLTSAAVRSVGITDGVSSFSFSGADQNNATPSLSAKRTAPALITVVRPDLSVAAEAALSSWNATDFTVTWSPNDTLPYALHFLAIGGSAVSAKAVAWTSPAGVGNRAVTGVGFQPDVVLHVFTGPNVLNLPNTSALWQGGLGAMDRFGGQWCSFAFSNEGNDPSETLRRQDLASVICQGNANNQRATYLSMDPDGFTVSYTAVVTGGNTLFSLALKGIPAAVGGFAKTTAPAPASQPVTGVGFAPAALLLASFQSVASPGTSPLHARAGLGATDGSASAASAVTSADALSPSRVRAIDKVGAAFVKVDNDADQVDATATLSSFGADGFTLSWSPNDAVPTEVLYLALGGVAPPGSRLVFTTPARTFTAGACGGVAGVITVQLQDGAGAPLSAGPGGQPFTASSSSPGAVSWYTDSGCASPAASGSFVIPAGATAVELYYRDTSAGTPRVSLTNASGLANPAPQAHVVIAAPASALRFTSPPRSILANACSPALVLEPRDAFGNPSPVATGTPLTLRSSAESTAFFSDPSCASPLTAPMLAGGAATFTFHFRDGVPAR